MPDDDPPPPDRPEGCEHCDKPCNQWYTRVDASGAVTCGMCADCPKAKSLLDPAQFTPFAAPPASGPSCHACGFTLADFEREKRFGCPLCYQTFGTLVSRVLAVAQPALCHTGKHPAKNHGALTQSRLAAARTELRQAVAKEDFESAARLRDEILALESGLKTSPKPEPPADAPPATPPT